MSIIVKRYLSSILVLAMIFSIFTINVSATEAKEENTIMPRWSVISSVGTSFVISGLNSTSTVSLSAQYSTSLYIKIEFQKEESTGYKTLETWEKSGTGTYLLLEETRLINIFADYRIKVTCKAGSETHTTYDYP